jgi:hypothetical protein
LSGVYNDNLYNSQLRVREIERELDKKTAELRGIFNVLGKSGQTPEIADPIKLIEKLEEHKKQLAERIESFKKDREISKKEASEANKTNESLRKKLSSAKAYESILKDRLSTVELEILDSKLFIRELTSRIESLDESKLTRDYFENLSFQFCPGCLSEIKPSDSPHTCHLCKASVVDKNGAQMLRMRNELSIQIKESTHIVDIKEVEANNLRKDIPLATAEIKKLENEYKSTSQTWSSETEIFLEQKVRELGALDEEIKQAYEKQKLASIIKELQSQRDKLSAELSALNESIESLQIAQESRKQEVARAVEKNVIRLLKKDLPLQVEFVNAENVKFDFEENSVYVNGSRNFSESSAVVLRHIFHLALLTTSLEIHYMRIPRLVILDGIDDGGMEKNRSHNLQKIIVEECSTYKYPYQLIYATSEITDEIEDSGMVVARAFTPESRSLDVR